MKNETTLRRIAQKIHKLRIEKGYTQETMADLLKMSDSGYAKMERGEVDISVSRLDQVAEVFGVKSEYLLGGENSNNSTSHGDGSGNNLSEIHVTGNGEEINFLHQLVLSCRY
jgi:transcriptional regulator with XRE-family HTH domain